MIASLLLLAPVAAAASLLAVLIVQATLSRIALSHLPLAPAPHTWFAGHVPALLVPGFHDVMVSWARALNNASYAIATPFGGRALIAADRKTVAAVLGARGARDRGARHHPHLPKFRRSYAVLDALWGGAPSVFTTNDEGAHWKRVRTLLAGAIGAGTGAKAAAPRGAAAAAALADSIAAAAAASPDGWATVDAVEAGLRLSMGGITTATLGDEAPGAPLAAVLDLAAPRPPAMEHLPVALEHAQLAMGHPAGEAGVWGKAAARGQAAVAAHAKFVTSLVDAWTAGTAPRPPPGTVGHALLTATPPLDRATLRAEVGMLLTAGFETTGKTLAFSLVELAACPRALAAVRAEAEAAGLHPPTLPSAADLARLPYTAAVVKEALRLHPVVPGVPRTAPLKGARVDPVNANLPFGTYVFALLKAVHTDPSEWGDDADDFKPERWLAGDAVKDHDGTGAADARPYWPFSTGPRDCPGRFMAMAFATATLAALAVRVDLEAVRGRPQAEGVALTAHPAAEWAAIRVRGRK